MDACVDNAEENWGWGVLQPRELGGRTNHEVTAAGDSFLLKLSCHMASVGYQMLEQEEAQSSSWKPW